jgi:hypothetical protein
MSAADSVGNIDPTLSENEQYGAKVFHSDLTYLPRSIRWRIQLGLLQDPSISDNGTSEIFNNGRCTLEDVTECNLAIVEQQNRRFRNLVEKHVEEDEEESKEQVETNGQSLEDPATSSNSAEARREVDPLTAMVMEQQAQETRKAELYLKYRKERARRKRGLSVDARVIESETNGVDNASVSVL